MYLQKNPEVIEHLKHTSEVKWIYDVCPFLRGTIGNTYCTIYPVRPEICQVFGTQGVQGLECPSGTVTDDYSAVEAEEIINKVYNVSEDNVGRYEEFFRYIIRTIPTDSEERCFEFFKYIFENFNSSKI